MAKKVEYKRPQPITFTGHEPVKDLFLRLTSWTCPHWTKDNADDHIHEHDLYGASLRKMGAQEDRYGNLYIQVGDSETLFCCHMDTADTYNDHPEEVRHTGRGNVIRSSGGTILGADNKAGMTIMLKMIAAAVPGTYAFFLAEELGCYGSRWASNHKDWREYKRAISFDREGYESIITRQWNGRCCSDGFARALADHLNTGMWSNQEMRLHRDRVAELPLFAPDPTGRATDSAMFVHVIPECTNISTGSFGSHTTKEEQNIRFLERLAHAATRVRWDDLPVYRQLP